jgi:hypothetical protein
MRLDFKVSGSKMTVNLGAATNACVRNVSTEFVLGRNYHNLDCKKFFGVIYDMFQGYGRIWRISKHLAWFGRTTKAVPISWIMKIGDESTRAVFSYLQARPRSLHVALLLI